LLYVGTDLTDTRWLRYLLDEFIRINRAEFPIQILPVRELDLDKKTSVLYYTKEFDSGPAIPNKSQVPPSLQVQWLSAEIFLINHTLTADSRFTCPYDLFWNAFVFLSRLEEYLKEQAGRKINSLARRHPRLDKTTFAVPVVNHLFDALEAIIRENFPGLPFGGGAGAVSRTLP
jgi:hypothetical protein